MRSPHRMAVSDQSPADPREEISRHEHPPYEETSPRNPYEELGALAPSPLEDFLREDPGDENAAEPPWQPPNHRRGSRRRRARFAGLPLAAKALVALAVAAAFLVLADRWALLYAEHEAADKLKDQLNLSAAPEVDIEGFPFLTQVLDQRLDEVKVTVPDVAADRVSLAKVSATATDVTMKGDGPTSLTGAVIGQMRGEVLLSFDDLNRELGASQVTFTGHGRDKVYARGTLPVAGHDLKVRADARIERNGERGVATDIDRMRLDIGDMATYRPGARESEGLHLSRTGARRVADESSQAKALLAVPEIARRLGVPDGAVREALRSDAKLNDVTGSPEFVDDVMRLNLIDVAMGHPALLKRLGLDPALLKGLDDLTRPVLVDRLSLSFELPRLPGEGAMRLQGVKVEEDGIRVGVEGYGIGFGG
ncbi:LmeA family phospholipid-binding protein [Streptomyces alboflavus]|uniref:LmeA family phospholipid-binding protein n=1 Tax=Streptomyces alboflavus TaxID=67267 RepID=UPI003685C41E